jgi:uncharacterized protein YecA (UPF0149 family)
MEVRKINLRLPIELHAELVDLAAWECVSANAVMVAALRNWITYRNGARPQLQPVKPGPVAPASVPRVGVNQPCPCGSGQKYKRCHGRL